MPIDNRTPNLNFQKPHVDNTLEEDVARLRAALDAIDAAIVARQMALGFTPENAANKGVAGGYASLDGSGLVPSTQLPSFVDDVLEFNNLAAFPGTGETGKIYVARDNGKTYRWSGTVYVEISASPGSTDAVPEGSVNLYFTPARAVAAIPIASAITLGLVRVGAGLSIDGSGVLTATAGGGSSMTTQEIVPGSNGLSSVTVPGGYVVGAILVGYNGSFLAPSDYTATNGTTINFVGFTVGTADSIVVVKLSTVTIGNLPDGTVTEVKLADDVRRAVRNQQYSSGTTAGTGTAYTLTVTPAVTAYAARQRFRITFHTAAGSNPTLSVSGLAAGNLRYRDSTGAKVAVTSAQAPTGYTADVEYDGSDFVMLDTADQVKAGGNNTFSRAQRGAYATLTDSATITPDFSLGNMFRVQLGGNRTLDNPTNLVEGQSGCIDVYQDNTGSRTLSYGWGWDFPNGVVPTLSTAARAKDKLAYQVDVARSSAVTISIATPGVVTWNNHGLPAGQQVRLSTTGALPTGLAINTTYFVIPVDANTFQLAATQSGSAIATSGTQSGTHTMTAVSITGQLLGAIA